MALVMPSESVSMLKFAFAAIVLYALTAFLTKLYVWRRRMLQLQRRGLVSQPPFIQFGFANAQKANAALQCDPWALTSARSHRL